MEKLNEKIKKITTKMAKTMIEHDSDEWPPVCTLFAYQPPHPSTLVQQDSTTSESSNS